MVKLVRATVQGFNWVGEDSGVLREGKLHRGGGGGGGEGSEVGGEGGSRGGGGGLVRAWVQYCIRI